MVHHKKFTSEQMLWCVFFCVQILYHLSIKVYFGDDVNVYSGVLDNRNLFEWLVERYNTWSSRLIVEGMLVFFVQNIFVWKIANIFVCSLFAFSLNKLSHGTSLFTVFVLLLFYPLVDMSSAGWVATFINYYWPLAFGAYSLLVLDKLMRGEEIYWWEIVLSFLTAIIGVNVEQYCFIQFTLLLLITFMMFMNRNFNKVWILLVHYLITCLSLAFILTAPGNFVRESSEVTDRMKDFYEKTNVDKFIDGFETTMSKLLSSSIIFLIFMVLLFVCVWKKSNSVKYRIVGSFPMVAVVVITLEKVGSNGFFAAFVGLITNNAGGIDAENWIKLSSYIPVIFYTLIVSCTIMSFFIIFDDFIEAFECSFIFVVAIASRVIMGFSPTLFASSDRTFIFCYFLLAFCVLRLLEYTDGMFSEKEIRRGKSLISVFCILAVLNNIVNAGNLF